MRVQWIFIESFAIWIENFAIFYFLNSRFVSKGDSRLPLIVAWIVLSIIGHIVVFTDIVPWVYNVSAFVIPLMFLWIFKNGSVWSKIIGVSVALAMLLGTTIIVLGVVSRLMDVSISQIQLYQDIPRLMGLVLAKSAQVTLFFAFSKRRGHPHGLKSASTLLFLLLLATIFAGMMIIFIGIDGMGTELNNTVVWLSVGMLAAMIIVFALYEMFAREESKNITLTANLQRMETEKHYFHEIDAVYANIRKWQHEYKTNITAIKACIEDDDKKRALDYIGKLNLEPMEYESTLRTGNVILDAIVSSKFSLARSKGIEIEIHAIYPQESEIDDMDLCAIVGNLLDNAIEACQKITDKSRRKFISFSLLPKRLNIAISVRNSYEGDIIKQGSRYLSSKRNHFQGIGMGYIDSIVDKYDGHIIRKHEYGVFETGILLPYCRKKSLREGKIL